jgi:hypothetical protein
MKEKGERKGRGREGGKKNKTKEKEKKTYKNYGIPFSKQMAALCFFFFEKEKRNDVIENKFNKIKAKAFHVLEMI